jgi:Bacterial CdiA-CT RNAse A domain
MLWMVGCGAPAPQTFHEEQPAAESRHEEKRERKEERREKRREARREGEAPGEFRESERKEDESRDRQPSQESATSSVHAGPRGSGLLAAGRYDLQRDEQLGGHTLRKHVGRSDEELRERLEQNTHISAASTWTNTDLAEQTVAAALRDQAARIAQWQARGERRANLALHYNAGREIGRSLERGASQTVPCTAAVIVLRANDDGFYVLTTYPEARR